MIDLNVPTQSNYSRIEDFVYKSSNSYNCNPISSNWFDESQLLKASSWSLNSNGYYTGSSGNLYNKFRYGFDFPRSFRENTQYTIKLTVYTSSGAGNPRFLFHYTDGTTSSSDNWNYTTPTTLTSTSSANKTIDYISYGYGSAVGTIYMKDIIIYEGSSSAVYVPYEGCLYGLNLYDSIDSYFLTDNYYLNCGIICIFFALIIFIINAPFIIFRKIRG